ncbi:hypothetical protein IJX73_03135 [bacterium]|nr:hypothetical protein [bacterium]
MKKIMTLSAIIISLAGVSFAAVHEDDTSNIDRLRAQGYSEQTLRTIDTVKSMNQHGNYETYYENKKSNAIGQAYTKLKRYVDPKQDDNKFGVHQINFTNTFFDDETEYATRKKPKNSVENL